ncbi:MAG TPA: CerR family C-terminal domain-containing protein [Anaeromyxobacter sp.]|nr:CerR family C-terminal domain-containing protein [Anaeromyxobacter sp.]
MTRAPALRRRPRGPGRDDRTRRRLLEQAAELFAERGFEAVSVRELCRAAGANLAAVNYHFGDKAGLYGEVVERAIATMHALEAEAWQGAPTGPEERLRAYVGAFLERIASRRRGSWVHRLLSREFEAPTPALDRVVERVFRPRLARLAAIVAELMGCPPGDPRVGRAVASVQGQCLLYRNRAVASRLDPGWRPTPERLDELADHVTRFSVAGIRALASPRARR